MASWMGLSVGLGWETRPPCLQELSLKVRVRELHELHLLLPRGACGGGRVLQHAGEHQAECGSCPVLPPLPRPGTGLSGHILQIRLWEDEPNRPSFVPPKPTTEMTVKRKPTTLGLTGVGITKWQTPHQTLNIIFRELWPL